MLDDQDGGLTLRTVVSRFYVLEIGNRTQYKFAWCEPYYRNPEEYRTSDDYPTCPTCGGAIGMRRWLPPHRVAIRQPRQIGDFLDGPFSFVVSERFKLLYEKSTLTGLKKFHPLEVVKMGAKKNDYPSHRYSEPTLCTATRESTTIFRLQSGGGCRNPIIVATVDRAEERKGGHLSGSKAYTLRKELGKAKTFFIRSTWPVPY
jgi:hypothetical protein